MRNTSMDILTTTFKRLHAMRPAVRSLVLLYWIYSFASSMVGVFTQIFLYQRFNSIALNITAAIVIYTGTMVGFCVGGYFAALWRMNIKRGFLISFIIMGVAIFALPHAVTAMEAYGTMFVWGIGLGVVWLTINTFELTETKDKERDFYSSVLTAGNQVISLAGPALATLLIWLSGSILHIGTYSLLFTIAPIVFLLGFFCFEHIRDYRPSPLVWADVKHYFTDRANQAAQLYTFGTGLEQTLGTTVPPLVILLILGTALRVGIYDTFFAIFSALCVIVVARYRTESNRLLIYGVTSLGILLATIWFGFAFSFVALIIYTVVEGILSPINGVSSHVVDLKTMEIGRKETDFYATMILRDLFLWIWRVVAGVIFLIIISYLGSGKVSLSAGMYLLALGILVTYLGAFWFIKLMQKKAA